LAPGIIPGAEVSRRKENLERPILTSSIGT
jgi:hypothetical protein